MTTIDTWNSPGPGPWLQDQAHNPDPLSPAMAEIFPPAFSRGFAETFAQYGVLLDNMAMGIVNGFPYMQPQPFDMPGPDGPPTHDFIVSEIGRRTGLAINAFEGEIWNDDLRLWDNDVKPRAIAAHRELNSVNLAGLDTAGLSNHLSRCAAHLSAMVQQHHRFNVSALLAVGDFLLQVSNWAGMPPPTLFEALGGSSPVSGLASSELTAVMAAIRSNPQAEQLVRGDGDPAQRISALRSLLPEVHEYLANTEYRLVEGFDVTRPTGAERPALQLGKIVAALDSDPHAATRAAQAFSDQLRAKLAEEHRGAFDHLLGEARKVYRLRDERGIYSDISAGGVLRLAMLEAGRRLAATGRVADSEQALNATVSELIAMLGGAVEPTAAALGQRYDARMSLQAHGAPRHLGPPPPEPPPVDMLPPPLARLMSSVGFLIDGILGELPEALGDDAVIVGISAGIGVYEGRARLVHNLDDLFAIEQGDVLVTPATGEAFNSMIHLVGAIVTDHGSFACHAAIMARELGFPAVVGTVSGSRRIRDGARVRVDANTGEVTVLD